MVVKEPKTVNEMCSDGIENRVRKLLEQRDYWLNHLNDAHVILQKGNTKSGTACWTVSLAPIIDCANCSGCRGKCYDIRKDCIYPSVINDRARNSAIHLADPERYWKEISEQIKANFVEQLRINVGGDLSGHDFHYIAEVAKENPQCDILFFTKNYVKLNDFLRDNQFPSNVHPIMSRWEGMDCQNPHNLPESHILWKNGTTTAPMYGAYFCGGNCTECHFNKEGCWTLKNGEHVIFAAH